MKKLTKKQTGGDTPKKPGSNQVRFKGKQINDAPYYMYPDSTGSKQPKSDTSFYKRGKGAILKNAPKVGSTYKKGGATKSKKK